MEGVYNGSKIMDWRLDMIIDNSKTNFEIKKKKHKKVFNPKSSEIEDYNFKIKKDNFQYKYEKMLELKIERDK